jgi:hypothetical protein
VLVFTSSLSLVSGVICNDIEVIIPLCLFNQSYDCGAFPLLYFTHFSINVEYLSYQKHNTFKNLHNTLTLARRSADRFI